MTDHAPLDFADRAEEAREVTKALLDFAQLNGFDPPVFIAAMAMAISVLCATPGGQPGDTAMEAVVKLMARTYSAAHFRETKQ
jgi:hypothetical protein